MLLSSNRQNVDTNEPWVKAVSEHLPLGRVSKVPRPAASFFVCNKEKLLYAPIAKCGCTSLKTLMVELSALEHEDLILQHGVHRVTDVFITGAQLKDQDSAAVESILHGDEYFKFSVVRDPVRRIVSAYTEKFLVNRHNAANTVHTIDPIRQARCQSKPDLDRGITFREFVHYLVQSQPHRLDSHWAPQTLYLRGVSRYDAIFTMEQMDELANRLSAITGKGITLGKRNASVAPKAGQSATHGRYADTLPCDIDTTDQLSAEDFMAPDLVGLLESFYREDLALYQAAQAGLGGYEPPALLAESFEEEHPEVPLTGAPEIARFVSIYTKGFFLFNSEGEALVNAIIINTGKYRLDFDALPSCFVVYEIRDQDAQLVHPPAAQQIRIGIVEPGGNASVSLEMKLPKDLIESAASATLSLRFGDEFFVVDDSPLHVAVAVRAGTPGS